MFRVSVAKNKITVDRTQYSDFDFEFRTSLGGHRILGAGQIINSDVVQLRCPGGIRHENAISSLFSANMSFLMDFHGISQFAEFLANGVQGGFCAAGVTARGDKGLIVCHNVPYRFDGARTLPTGGDKRTAVYLMGVQKNDHGGTLDFLESEPVTAPPVGAGLFVVDDKTARWDTRFMRRGDRRVTYGRLSHEYVDGIDRPSKRIGLLYHAIRYAEALKDAQDVDIRRIYMDFRPNNCAIELAVALTRVCWQTTNGLISLELPLYESDIAARIIEAY